MRSKNSCRTPAEEVSEHPDAVLFQDADVLFPAATEDVITEKNAGRIRAPCIVEGANNPTSEEAYRVLAAQGKLVVPDVIANAGGIIAAFVEMTADQEAVRGSSLVERAKDLTIEKIAANTRQLMEMVTRLGVQPNHAGYFLAFRNIFGGPGE